MKKSAIIGIFNGFKGNLESMKAPKLSKENLEILCKTYDELKQKLSPEMLKMYNKFIDAKEAVICEEIDFYFAEGFKLGLLDRR